MARYFFHTNSPDRFSDDLGHDLPSADHARSMAILYMAEILRDAPNQFWRSKPWSVTVADQNGLQLFAIEVTAQTPRALISPLSKRGGTTRVLKA